MHERSFRCVAGLEGIPREVSCGNDAKDEPALELEAPVDNPGTTIGKKFSVLHWILLLLSMRRGF